MQVLAAVIESGNSLAALKRGMKLVVIDPRRSDLAERAHVHLQVKPGEDASLLACLIREIIERGWYDTASRSASNPLT